MKKKWNTTFRWARLVPFGLAVLGLSLGLLPLLKG
jgi:hypothetical protein